MCHWLCQCSAAAQAAVFERDQTSLGRASQSAVGKTDGPRNGREKPVSAFGRKILGSTATCSHRMQLRTRSLTFITIRSLGACARKQLIGIGRVPTISFANRRGNSILICRLSMVCRLVHWTRTRLECSNPSVSIFPILPPEDTGKASGTQNVCPCHPAEDSLNAIGGQNLCERKSLRRQKDTHNFSETAAAPIR